LRDLIDYQEDSKGISHFQECDEMRSLRDLIHYQEGKTKNSDCQVGNEMGFEDLIECQDGRRELPYCQEGKGE
jgi:hypothetical protein